MWLGFVPPPKPSIRAVSLSGLNKHAPQHVSHGDCAFSMMCIDAEFRKYNKGCFILFFSLDRVPCPLWLVVNSKLFVVFLSKSFFITVLTLDLRSARQSCRASPERQSASWLLFVPFAQPVSFHEPPCFGSLSVEVNRAS